jgi:hypothetical protein
MRAFARDFVIGKRSARVASAKWRHPIQAVALAVPAVTEEQRHMGEDTKSKAREAATATSAAAEPGRSVVQGAATKATTTAAPVPAMTPAAAPSPRPRRRRKPFVL